MKQLKKHWGDDSNRTFYGLDVRQLFYDLPLGGVYDMTMVSNYFVEIEEPKVDNMRVEVSVLTSWDIGTPIERNVKDDLHRSNI